ncbi:N-acetylglucosamine-6-phosphate deacetylase [Pedobacter xixiisoli]|uniref:N-acetylglucosamine-6-phosphate deacetylase n=1 Tax=Pedobacter xixiisoli TaxID=1476464 RepID=A0A286ACT8_9SPHI|nr:N-acetylglucosamine-6-phosphate deacetylase [Pedobacter xixiisoli]SOD19695.1 N-acetylglucosamine-6-phosphate deacetylase [Pedobacter xixiisoli]
MQSLQNQNLYFPKGVKLQQDISFENGLIKEIKANPDTLKVEEKYLVPGFIDLQIYGAGGKLFSAEPNPDSIRIIEDQLLQEGTTSFLICLATNTPEVFNQCISVIKEYRSEARNCLGLHLEGPFINPEKRGAHVKEYIRKASLDEIKQLLDFGDGTIKMMTLAPELQDEKVIQYLLDHHVIVSLGHSSATFEQATKAYNQGVQTTTHLFNAMSPLQHRAPGIPTAIFNHPMAMASIIVDGLHVDFEVVNIAAKVMKERLFLITDAVAECHTGPYQHHAVDGKFVMPDGTLSGSAMTMLQSIKNCVKYCGISLSDAINMATYYPSKLIKKENEIGQLAVNAEANFVVLDEDMNIAQVFYKGSEIKLNKAASI